MNKNLIITAIIALLVGVGGFYGGMKYQQSQAVSRFTNLRGENAQFVQRMGGQNGNGLPTQTGFQPVNGEIISSDDTSITVKLQDGSSRIVLLSDSTTINKAETGSKEDLKNGEKVFVVGNSNSDGSISANSIQLNSPDRLILRQEDQ